jgi:hypothetical protein
MWQYSKPYAAGDYSALSFATCETSSDELVAIREVGGNLAMLGSQSLEIWGIGSKENIPFELIRQSSKNIGCVSRENSCVIDESLFFIGKNRSGEVSAYILKDMELVEVGTPDMVAIWGSYGALPICSFAWHYRGHVFYQVEFKNNTWVYDATSDAWHKSTDAGGAPNGFMAAIGNTSGVSFLSAKSFSITRAIHNSGKENARQLPRGFTTKSIIDPNKFRIAALQVIAESSGKSGGGTLDLEISINGGMSWTKVLPQKSLVKAGATSDIPRLFWSNLGATDRITFRVIAKSDTDITVTDIWGAIERISANMDYGV